MDCFDADVLIYAVIDGHVLGHKVLYLFDSKEDTGELVGTGSIVLLPVDKATLHLA